MGYRLKVLRYLVVLFILLLPAVVAATPSQYGDSGLISVPTSEITERGLFQSSIWINHSQNNGKNFTLMPVAISMGIGDSWELSGSYPNVLLNNQNDGSMRGFENIGLKYRIWGYPQSDFKAAVSAFLRQAVSDEEEINGLRDLGARLILSYKLTNAAVHINAGYLKVDSPSAADYKDETLFGGVVEFPVSDRVRPFVEVDGNTNREGGSSRIELTPGLQYYLLPYLSATGGVGFGLTDTGPDYRVTAGLTFTSGAGSYIKAIPVIPGSRERYAAASVTPEELMPDIPIAGQEGIAEGIAPPAPGLPGMEGLEVPFTPPSPSGVSTPAAKAGTREILLPGGPVGLGEAPPVSLEPPMPVFKAMPVEKAAAPEKAALKPEIPAEAPAVTFAPPLPVGKAEVKAEAPPAKKERKETVVKFGPPHYAILYFFNKRELSPFVKEVLDRVAREIREDGRVIKKIRVEGHTDSVGSASSNKKLSYRRAESAKMYLVEKHGFPAGLLETIGRGEDSPVASNSTPEGMRENRRVEIYVHLEE